MDKEVVKELIQDACTTQNIQLALEKILNPKHRANLLQEYTVLEQLLGGVGASEKVADLIVASCTKEK